MFGEEENYKSLWILEADTIKQVEMKFKKGRSNLDERKSFSKPNTTTERSSKEQTPEVFPFQNTENHS